jgi:hypothetical protein
MRHGVVSVKTGSLVQEEPKDGLQQGIGALLLLAGSLLVYSDTRIDRSSVGGGLGFLLLLVGSGLMFVPRPWEVHPAP